MAYHFENNGDDDRRVRLVPRSIACTIEIPPELVLE